MTAIKSLTTTGGRIRTRRKMLQLTLREVAEASGITESYLSQIERGKAVASVATLQRITANLKMTLGELFQDPSREAQVDVRFRDAEPMEFAGGVKFKVSPNHFGQLEVLIGTFEPGGSTGEVAYTHGDSEETMTVMEGRVIHEVAGQQYRLIKFDSVRYRSSEPHRTIEATGTDTATVLWAIAPPTY